MKTRTCSMPLLAVFGLLLVSPGARGQLSRNMALSLNGINSYVRLPAIAQMPASNSVGQSLGSDGSFTTSPSPPAVTSLPARQITTTRATFQGTVNPNSVAASAWFE